MLHRKRTEKQIAIMQACIDGEEIEIFYDNEWDILKAPKWNWVDLDYRIKPVIKEYWLNEYKAGGILAYTSKEAAVADAIENDDIITNKAAIHVRTVMD